MRSEIVEIQRSAAQSDAALSRIWYNGQHTLRSDAAMISGLNVATIDAVFDEEAISFIDEPAGHSEGTVESLTSQLTALEAQCAKLRSLLGNAAVDAR